MIEDVLGTYLTGLADQVGPGFWTPSKEDMVQGTQILFRRVGTRYEVDTNNSILHGFAGMRIDYYAEDQAAINALAVAIIGVLDGLGQFVNMAAEKDILYHAFQIWEFDETPGT